MRDFLLSAVGNPTVLAGWLLVAAVCVAIVLRDLAGPNRAQGTLMKWVWVLTVLYSGLIGLVIYWTTGRAQIRRDSVWRRGFRSVAHCYSGCGAGEAIGVVVTAGILGLGNYWVAGVSFALAYVIGYALTLGPLLEGGESFGVAMKDTIVAETLSIGVMEITAIGLDLWLAAGAGFAEPLFWGSLILSLSVGLFAAYPVNVVLIALGVKEGMHDPRHMAHGHAHAH